MALHRCDVTTTVTQLLAVLASLSWWWCSVACFARDTQHRVSLNRNAGINARMEENMLDGYNTRNKRSYEEDHLSNFHDLNGLEDLSSSSRNKRSNAETDRLSILEDVNGLEDLSRSSRNKRSKTETDHHNDLDDSSSSRNRRSASDGDPVVKIGSSSVIGLKTRVLGKTVYRYLGIRYAQAPTGSRRFRTPVPAELPEEVDATRFGARCLQFPLRNTGMSEDCLFLNVYTPTEPGGKHSADSLLPVLVFIHGGGFIIGASDLYEGDELAAEGDIVVVTLNYRLGALGFLSTGDNSSLGNYGLWDQRLALQWVQKHIDHFGGDSKRVTVAGMSSGASSAAILSLSPLSRTLFRHVIQLSGSAASPWARVSQSEALQRAVALGKRVGCSSDHTSRNRSSSSLVDCLRHQPVERIVTSSTVLYPRLVALSLVDYTWVPVRDGVLVTDLDGATSFAGPLLAGLVDNEGEILYSWTVPRVGHYILDTEGLLSRRGFYREHLLPTLLKQAFPELVSPPYPSKDLGLHEDYRGRSLSNAIRTLECAYLDDAVLAARDGHAKGVETREVAEVFGDQAFVMGTVKHLQQFCTYQPSFLYYMQHQTKRPGVTGMRHVDDLAFLFGFDSTIAKVLGFEGHITDLDRRLARDFRQVLVNFIQTGDPNSPERPTNWPLWPPYTSKGADYLVLSASPRVASHLKADKMELWTQELPRLLTTVNANVSDRWQCYSGSSAAGLYSVSRLSWLVWWTMVVLWVVDFARLFNNLQCNGVLNIRSTHSPH